MVCHIQMVSYKLPSVLFNTWRAILLFIFRYGLIYEVFRCVNTTLKEITKYITLLYQWINFYTYYFWGNLLFMRNIQCCWCVYAHLRTSSKERKFGICNKIRLIHICCCIVVHVMLPVIRLSLHDDVDVKVQELYNVVSWKLSFSIYKL